MRNSLMACALSLLLLTAGVSVAQNYPQFEVPLGFSLVNIHPEALNSFNLFGGGGGLVYNFSPLIGIKADVMGYAQGGNQHFVEGGHVSGNVSGNLFTYLFGIQVKKHNGKIQPFGEALFGGAHTNFYANICKIIGCGADNGGNSGFAMEYGLGLDVPLTKSIQLRPVEVDYLYTRFGSNVISFNASHSQNNFKYVGGVNFTFGGK